MYPTSVGIESNFLSIPELSSFLRDCCSLYTFGFAFFLKQYKSHFDTVCRLNFDNGKRIQMVIYILQIQFALHLRKYVAVQLLDIVLILRVQCVIQRQVHVNACLAMCCLTTNAQIVPVRGKFRWDQNKVWHFVPLRWMFWGIVWHCALIEKCHTKCQ